MQRTVKDTVVELLRVFLKGVFPKKTDDAITNLLQQRLHGVLGQDEWIDIVKYMYDRDDSMSLIATVRDFIDSNPAPSVAPDGTRCLLLLVTSSHVAQALPGGNLDENARALMQLQHKQFMRVASVLMTS